MIKEKIFFINQLNSVELLRTLTRQKGNSDAFYYFYHETQLVEYILNKRGLFLKGTFINEEEASLALFDCLKDDNVQYEDAKYIKSSISSYEQCQIDDVYRSMNNVLNDDFPLKKDILLNAYQKYQQYKKENQLYDYFDQVRFILSLDWSNKFQEVYYFKQFPLTKTQNRLLNTVFCHVKEDSIDQYIKNENTNVQTIIKSYGAINEINQIFNIINKNKYCLGDCQIVLLDNSYINYLINKKEYLSYLSQKDFPLTIHQGYPLLISKPGQLLLCLKKLMSELYSVNAYENMFNCPSFNQNIFLETLDEKDYEPFKKYVGWLRLSFEKDIKIEADYQNECIKETLNNFANDIKQGIPYFIKKYCIIEGDPYGNIALKAIEDTFNLYKKYGIDDLKIVDLLLAKNIAPSLSSSSSIHVTNIDFAFMSNRRYTFIVGLSNAYINKPVENSLIFDDEYEKIDENGYFCSKNIVKRKEQLLNDFLLICGQTYISYPYYRYSDQKSINASLVVNRYLDSCDIKTVDFKDDDLSYLKNVIDSYQRGNNIINPLISCDNNKYDPNILLNKKYSPSSFAHYFLGNKVLFFLSALLDVEINEESDPFEIISPLDRGTLLHSVMEKYQQGDDKQAVRNKASVLFDNYLKMRTTDIFSKKDEAKASFMNAIECLLNLDLGNMAECEHYYEGKIGKLSFGGKVDRIAKIDNKEVLIDYKTGDRVKHFPHDKKTFIQGLIYAYLVNHNQKRKHHIKEIWFVYPYQIKQQQIQKIVFDQEAIDTLFSCIEEIERFIESGDFVSFFHKEDDFDLTDGYKYLSSLYQKLSLKKEEGK